MLLGLLNQRVSDSELALEEADATFAAFEFRCFLGPAFDDLIPEDLYWNREPPASLFASSAIQEVRLNIGQIVLQNASGFPPRGSIFVGGPQTRCRYASRDETTLYGVSVAEGIEGDVQPGAIASAYWEFSDLLTSPVELSGHFRKRVFRWEARLRVRGLRLIERDLGVVILRRKLVGSETKRRAYAWHVMCAGWVMESSYERGWEEGQDQELVVGGFVERFARMETPPLSSRTANLAQNASATATSTLTDLLLEAGSDDYVMGTPLSVQPEQAVDGDINTLWISMGEPSALTWTNPVGGSDAVVIDEVFAFPPIGRSENETWFRLWPNQRTDLARVRIVNDQTLWVKNQAEDTYEAADLYLDTEGSKALSGRVFRQEPVVFCRNLTAFRARWDPGQAFVVEWISQLPNSRRPNEFRLNPIRGYLHARSKGPGWNDTVCWGEGSGRPSGRTVSGQQITPDWPQWTGPWVKAPPPGHSIRTYPPHTNWNTASNWEENPAPNPAGQAAETGMETTERLTIFLPDLNLTLGQDLSADPNDPPSGAITILEGGTESTASLEDRGAVLIDGEVITYTGRTPTQITGIQRAQFGTSPQPHLAGAAVAIFEDGVAWTIPKVKAISYLRPPERNPRIFAARLFLSPYASPRQPETPGWEADWEHVFTWQNAASLSWTSPGKRVKSIMLVIDQMASLIGYTRYAIQGRETRIYLDTAPYFSKAPSSGYAFSQGRRFRYTGKGADYLEVSEPPELGAGAPVYHLGGRARVNEVRVEPATLPVQEEGSVPSGEIADILVFLLIRRGKVPAQRVRRPAAFLPGPNEYLFARGSLLEMISEICETYRLFLIEYPDGSFAIEADLERRSEEPRLTWTTGRLLRMEASRDTLSDVSQLILRLRDPVTQETRVFRYPPEPGSLGKREEVERSAPLFLGPVIAQEEFEEASGRRSWRLEPAGLVDFVWGNHLHRLPDGTIARVIGIRVQEGSEYEAEVEVEEV